MSTLLRGIVVAFLRLAGEEAVRSYKRRKAREDAEKKERDSRVAAAVAKAEADKLMRIRQARIARHVAEMDKITQRLQAAQRQAHKAEMRQEARNHPIPPNPYED